MKIWTINLYNCDLVTITTKLKVQFKLKIFIKPRRTEKYVYLCLNIVLPVYILRYNHLTILRLVLLFICTLYLNIV